MTITLVEAPKAQRDEQGRLLPGHGLGGRPKGSGDPFRRGVYEDSKGLVPAAIAVVREQLGQSNAKVAMWLLDRFLPAERLIDLPVASPAGLAEALATGDITPSESAKAAAALKTISDIEEVRMLRDRLDHLEHVIAEKEGR